LCMNFISSYSNFKIQPIFALNIPSILRSNPIYGKQSPRPRHDETPGPLDGHGNVVGFAWPADNVIWIVG